ncbi:MAG: class I lanthipeptide [Bacteroidales bacterium]|jgi:hypothetical protein|nr:class I lanthipeptide [Bacteroidales bacterium]
MEQKNLNKKLQLNKETIARLDSLNEIKGGGTITDTCPVITQTCNSCPGGTCGTDAACPTAVGATCTPTCNNCPPSIVICI